MGQLLKSTSIHIEAWLSRPIVINHPHKLLLPLPPYQRPEVGAASWSERIFTPVRDI